jgi:parvulin-like peptidyl-prolyl isomerase
MPLIVNGETIDDAIIRQEVNATRPRYEEMVDGLDPVQKEIQLWDWSRETVIERALLRQEAMRDPRPIPEEQIAEAVAAMKAHIAGQPSVEMPSEEYMRREVEEALKLERLIQAATSKVPVPKHKETGEFYKKNRERFVAPELVHAKHIVKNVDEQTTEDQARAAIEEAAKQLQAGRAFEDVANETSDCAGNGGDLGFFPRGEMVDEFDRVVFDMQPGEVSPVFQTTFGYHIAKVYARRPAGYLGFQDVREHIEKTLLRQRRETALENFVDQLKAKANIRKS